MELRVARGLSERSWQRFVEGHPGGNIFHTPEMFQVFARAEGHEPELWATVRGERVLALLLPVQINLMGGPLRWFTTRSVVYGGVLCEPGDEGCEALALLLHAYTKGVPKMTLFTELRNLHDLTELQPMLAEEGFVYEDHLNYLIDLDRPAADILANISRRTRKRIRRGNRKEEVQIEELGDSAGVSTCYNLLQETYGLAQVPLADYSLFKAAFDILYPKGMVRFTLASIEGASAATSVELMYKDVVYGWYGGVDREFSSYVPNELLTWHILEWSAQNGYRMYDFGGAGKPDEDYGPRDFKSKFGGELVCFGRNTCVHAPGRLRFSESGYELLRRLGVLA